jgi:hypothetical protein
MLIMEAVMPRHGEVRSWRMESERSSLEVVLPGGEVASVPGGGTTDSVCEKFCATCDRWFEVRGAFGALCFWAEHDHHGRAP